MYRITEKDIPRSRATKTVERRRPVSRINSTQQPHDHSQNLDSIKWFMHIIPCRICGLLYGDSHLSLCSFLSSFPFSSLFIATLNQDSLPCGPPLGLSLFEGCFESCFESCGLLVNDDHTGLCYLDLSRLVPSALCSSLLVFSLQDACQR